MTTIHISKETKQKLDKLKIHRREPYEDLLKRLLMNWELKGRVVDETEINKGKKTK